MSKRYPWSAWYWDDWDAHTAHLSHVQYSIYHRLLKHYYRTQKPLVANASDLARVCLAVGTAEVADLQSVLAQFFTLRADGYHNKRADEEILRALNVSKLRQEVGKKGGLAKARNLVEQKATHPQSHIHKTQKRGATPTRYTQADYDERDYRLFCEAREKLTLKLNSGWGRDLTDDQLFAEQCALAGRTPQKMREVLDRLEGAASA